MYGFPYIADCIGSDFRGPCKNASAPVPCGDGTCRSDFVDCLRSLSRLELRTQALQQEKQQRQEQQGQEQQDGAPGGVSQADSVPEWLRGAWTFDGKGVLKDGERRQEAPQQIDNAPTVNWFANKKYGG